MHGICKASFSTNRQLEDLVREGRGRDAKKHTDQSSPLREPLKEATQTRDTELEDHGWDICVRGSLARSTNTRIGPCWWVRGEGEWGCFRSVLRQNRRGVSLRRVKYDVVCSTLEFFW